MNLRKRIKSDSGLMGPTHALSAIAFTLLATWLAKDFMFNTVLGTNDMFVYIAAIIVIVGASLMPDLDATRSTLISTLGVVGNVLSTVMRSASKIIQSTLRSKYDASDPDPHRGFWHTIIAALIAGLLVTLLTRIDTTLFTVGEKQVSIALFVVIFIIFLSTQLFIASLMKPLNQKMKKKPMIKLVVSIISLLLTLLIVALLPKELSYNWVGAAITFGWLAHLVGDMLTVAGVPVLFPLKIKGKRWFNLRSPLGIKAGGFIEFSILTPVFAIIIIVAAFKVLPMLT